MADEEKREYEELKNLLYTGTISQYGKRKLIDIIEKQSKEIERLEKKVKRYEKIIEHKDEKCEQLLEFAETEKETDYVSKDKIKAKIEELDEEIKAKREIAKNPMDRVSGRLLTDSIVELEKTKKVLQSLLEKE